MWVESHLELCQITNNQINHNLIKIIQLSLTIFDLWSHSHLWVVGWMDILTFFDIFLKPPQPFTGLFSSFLTDTKGNLGELLHAIGPRVWCITTP